VPPRHPRVAAHQIVHRIDIPSNRHGLQSAGVGNKFPARVGSRQDTQPKAFATHASPHPYLATLCVPKPADASLWLWLIQAHQVKRIEPRCPDLSPFARQGEIDAEDMLPVEFGQYVELLAATGAMVRGGSEAAKPPERSRQVLNNLGIDSEHFGSGADTGRHAFGDQVKVFGDQLGVRRACSESCQM
jgi:hypothetical protein